MSKVLQNPIYITLGLFSGLSVLLFNVVVSSVALWTNILSDDLIGAGEKIALIGRILTEHYTNSDAATNIYVIAMAVGVGINIPLLFFYYRNYRPGVSLSGLPVSVLGVLSGIFGVGCLACGSIFFSAFFASAAGFLSLFPFGGTEIGFVGLCLIYISSFLLLKDIPRRT